MVVSSQSRDEGLSRLLVSGGPAAAGHYFHERLRLDTTPSRKLLFKAAPTQ
jgi:hypothetical protein